MYVAIIEEVEQRLEVTTKRPSDRGDRLHAMQRHEALC